MKRSGLHVLLKKNIGIFIALLIALGQAQAAFRSAMAVGESASTPPKETAPGGEGGPQEAT